MNISGNNENIENEINENKIIEIPKDNLENKKGIDDKDKLFLFELLNGEDILDSTKTKINKKDDFILLINIIMKFDDDEFILFMNYLDMEEISIYKIIINGYIDFDFQEKSQETNIFNIISKIIFILFSKRIFYFIYDKLSKFYRLHNEEINDLDSLRKFEKIFNIWKLLYDTKIYCKNDNNNSAISFFPNKKEKYFTLYIKEKIKINHEEEIDQTFITIKFLSYFLLDINNSNKNFSFLNCYDKDGKEFKFTYNSIFKDNNNINNNINSFSDIQTIQFRFLNQSYIVIINDKLAIKEKADFNFNYIEKIEILDNFFGKIEYFSLEKELILIPKEQKIENQLSKKKFKLEIKKKNFHIHFNSLFEFNSIKIENQIHDYIDYEGKIFSCKLANKNTKFDLINIKYFGGLNSFIPIFKIIKYIILQVVNVNINKKNQENYINVRNDYIKQSIIWIKDILKIIIKLVCISEKNYNNFLEIAISLIGALGEIFHTLNELLSLNIITNEIISLLFNDEIFFILFIIILNSSLPRNIKKIFNKLFGINNNIKNFNFTMKPLIVELDEIKDLDWYFLFLFTFIEFNILYLDSQKTILKVLIDHLNNIKSFKEKKLEDIALTLPFISFVEEYCFDYKDNNTNILFKNYHSQLKKRNLFLKYTIFLIKTFLNIKMASKILDLNFNNDIYSSIQESIILSINSNFIGGENILYDADNLNQIIKYFKDYTEYFSFIQQFFPLISENNFTQKNKLIMNELIDIHGQYRHVMNDLFVFNRLWSNQELFFKNSLEEMKKAKLKYKNINYYTKNFERPIIYPSLDYKYHYPDFSLFNINTNQSFYYKYDEEEEERELKDDYNFEIDCPEIDSLILENDNQILNEIEKEGSINIFNSTCLVKQAYHIKGNLFLVNDANNKKVTIYFYSYPYNFQNNTENKPSCNKTSKEKNILCYGSIFKCPKKEGNRKIKIESEDIRLMMKKIYFYRNSSVEIFTETKSYYFNFITENNRDDFFSLFIYPYENLYFPINIKKEEISGFKKINKKIMKTLNYMKLLNEKNNFINYITKELANSDICQMCIFDLLILINLISNRSYIDLHQYPVFPLINFYDKKNNKLVKRDMDKHIGFQNKLECSNIRYNLFQNLYNGYLNDYEEEKNNDGVVDVPHYFNTHYSNIVYTCNYLIRIFPYSFIAIELQGDGFDSPNRLFNSIEDTLYNISMQKSDLRELIPEFFYFPEMFMNINIINFHKNSRNELVDDVIITENCITNKEIKGKDININNQKFFIFIENLKNELESLKADINQWINIIFGIYQKKDKNNEQTFREESYIDINDKTRKKYLKNKIILESVDFGLIPLQTIFNKKIYSFPENQKITKKNTIKKKVNKKPEENIKEKDNQTDKIYCKKYDMKENYFNNEFKQYWEEPLNIDFEISEEDNIYKLKLYKENILIDELNDHNDKIKDFFYNYRLNMFATTSYDGFICIYFLPNKLISMIKCKNNSYYHKIFLSANPFPSVIAYHERSCSLISYSISGLLIKEINLKNKNNSEIQIKPNFNIYGGTFNDSLIIKYRNEKIIKKYSVPFFELIKND